MARGINKHIVVGNVVRRPDVGTTKSGVDVCTLTVACTEYGGPEGEETEFFDCIVFGQTAKFCGDYLDKGRCVYVEGRGRQRKFTDKNGNDRVKYEVKAFKVEALGGKTDSQQPSKPATSGDGGYGGGGYGGGGYNKASDSEEIPF